MNKNKIIALVAILLVIAGLVGAITCALPKQSGAAKVISKYVSAINAGDLKKMSSCTYENQLADALEGMLGGSGSDDSQTKSDVYNALTSSDLDVAGQLPEGVTAVKSVKLVGTVEGKQESASSILGTYTGMNVEVTVKVVYTDAEGKSQTMYASDTIGLIKSDGKWLIA